MLPPRESSDFSLFHPNRSRPSPRRAFFLFRSIFRRAASVAHPSTNRRGGALSRRRVDGNGKASGVIFDFSSRRKSASRCWYAQFFQNSSEFLALPPRESLKNFEDKTEVSLSSCVSSVNVSRIDSECVFIARD